MEAVALRRRLSLPPLWYAVAILGLIVATIAGAFAFQAAGYPPCELCLKERLPYYAGMGLGPLAVAAAWHGKQSPLRILFALLTLLFLFSAGFGAWHAGVEWGLWQGPTDCTGSLDRATSSADFLRQLQNTRVVRCDAVAVRILGLSLAGWNGIVSAAIAAIALGGLFGRSPSLR